MLEFKNVYRRLNFHLIMTVKLSPVRKFIILTKNSLLHPELFYCQLIFINQYNRKGNFKCNIDELPFISFCNWLQ